MSWPACAGPCCKDLGLRRSKCEESGKSVYSLKTEVMADYDVSSMSGAKCHHDGAF